MASTAKKVNGKASGRVKTKTSARRKGKVKKTFLGYDIPEKAKLKVIGENPRREGSSVYKQYEKMRGGRTVAAYLKAGGRRRWIPGAVRREFIKVVR